MSAVPICCEQPLVIRTYIHLVNLFLHLYWRTIPWQWVSLSNSSYCQFVSVTTFFSWAGFIGRLGIFQNIASIFLLILVYVMLHNVFYVPCSGRMSPGLCEHTNQIPTYKAQFNLFYFYDSVVCYNDCFMIWQELSRLKEVWGWNLHKYVYLSSGGVKDINSYMPKICLPLRYSNKFVLLPSKYLLDLKTASSLNPWSKQPSDNSYTTWCYLVVCRFSPTNAVFEMSCIKICNNIEYTRFLLFSKTLKALYLPQLFLSIACSEMWVFCNPKFTDYPLNEDVNIGRMGAIIFSFYEINAARKLAFRCFQLVKIQFSNITTILNHLESWCFHNIILFKRVLLSFI